MVGIAGIMGTGPCGERQAALAAMLKCMLHTSSYTSGTHVDERLGLWSGWVSREKGFSDCRSQWNEQHNICVMFSGEEFTERAEIEQLKVRGHDVDPENANYIVHLYEEFGMEFLEKLNGSFSGVLVDLREQKVVLFNDRYGLNRIYFHENDSGFYFSSEAKSLLKVLPHLRQLDFKSLGEFYSCGCVLQNRTIFRGISLMSGGSAWTFRSGEPVRKECYFKRERWEQQPALSEGEYYEKLKDTWTRILPGYFRGREQVALSLTGGLDSRMILAWSPCAAGKLPCYTFAGKYRDCADVTVSREVARVCKQTHEVIRVGSEFLSEFPSLAERAIYISDGALDVTGSIDVYVQKLARQIAPVRITGTSGGEILRRLVAFKPASLCQDVLDPELDSHAQAAAVTYADELKGHRLSFTAFKQAPWYMGSKFVVERSQVTLRMPYCDNELVALAYRAPSECGQNDDTSLRLIAEGNPALSRIQTDRGGAFRALPHTARARHLFQEFTFKAEYAYDYGMPQWLTEFDHAFRWLHLERAFLGRHKIHHFRTWYRDELSSYVKEIMLDRRTLNRPYLRGACLVEMVNSHLRGIRNYTREIHKLLSIELVQRQLIESN